MKKKSVTNNLEFFLSNEDCTKILATRIAPLCNYKLLVYLRNWKTWNQDFCLLKKIFLFKLPSLVITNCFDYTSMQCVTVTRNGKIGLA